MKLFSHLLFFIYLLNPRCGYLVLFFQWEITSHLSWLMSYIQRYCRSFPAKVLHSVSRKIKRFKKIAWELQAKTLEIIFGKVLESSYLKTRKIYLVVKQILIKSMNIIKNSIKIYITELKLTNKMQQYIDICVNFKWDILNAIKIQKTTENLSIARNFVFTKILKL